MINYLKLIQLFLSSLLIHATLQVNILAYHSFQMIYSFFFESKTTGCAFIHIQGCTNLLLPPSLYQFNCLLPYKSNMIQVNRSWIQIIHLIQQAAFVDRRQLHLMLLIYQIDLSKKSELLKLFIVSPFQEIPQMLSFKICSRRILSYRPI